MFLHRLWNTNEKTQLSKRNVSVEFRWWWDESVGDDDKRRLPLHFHLIIIRSRDPGPGLAGEAGRPPPSSQIRPGSSCGVSPSKRGQSAVKADDWWHLGSHTEGITHTRKHKYSKLNCVKTVSRRNISVLTYIMCVCLASPHPPLPQKTALPKSLKTSPPLRPAPTKTTFVQRLWHVILTNILH